MCWFGKEKNLKIADKDIKVKKVLYKEVFKKSQIHPEGLTRIISPYMGLCYEVGKTYKEVIKPEKSHLPKYEIRIYVGLHCYSYECPHVIEKEQCLGCNVLSICKKPNIWNIIFGSTTNLLASFTDYKETQDVGHYKSVLLAEFIIPKGTKYYEDKRGEIVTEKYIFKGYTEI